MSAEHGARFWIEAALGGLSVTLLGMTLLVPDWIEADFGVNPDRHNGSFELAIAGLLLVAAVACGVLARIEWLRPQLGARAQPASSSRHRR
jgi:hypothetical protein